MVRWSGMVSGVSTGVVMRKQAGADELDTRKFKQALAEVLQRDFPGWQDNTHIDALSAFVLFIELKLELGRRGQCEEPANNPLIRDMTAREFVYNMHLAYGVTP